MNLLRLLMDGRTRTIQAPLTVVVTGKATSEHGPRAALALLAGVQGVTWG